MSHDEWRSRIERERRDDALYTGLTIFAVLAVVGVFIWLATGGAPP